MKFEFAKKLFKNNFIGPEELKSIDSKLNFDLPNTIPNINLNLSDINPDEYILIYGCSKFHDKTKFDIQKLIEIFGYNFSKDTVCFYNQDWYYSEKFINNTLSDRWYLIQKTIAENNRGNAPNEKIENLLPSSTLCAYTFFVWWLLRHEILWPNDFVWCNDKDKYGDRIYVGKFIDKDNINRSGFSIHRHLSIKKNYGSIISLT
jgi:hypothetical protein